MEYLTTNETESKWGISSRRIRILCEEGRVIGAVKKGVQWLIPATAEKPVNLKSGPKKANNTNTKTNTNTNTNTNTKTG